MRIELLMRNTFIIGSLICGGSVVALAGPNQNQPAEAQKKSMSKKDMKKPPAMSQTDQAGENRVTDKQIRKFMKAQQKVSQIYQNNKKAVDKKGAANANVQQQMIAAIKETGLKMGTYQKIAKRLQNDEEFQDRIRSLMGQ